MKIISYSDLHLEFGTEFNLPRSTDVDLLVLAGDICVFKDFQPLDNVLRGWNRPVVYVPGNHEYYTRKPISHENENCKTWLMENYPSVKLLLDEEATIDGVNFFGGTMWTDFAKGDSKAMDIAEKTMNDFRLIRTRSDEILKPIHTIEFHKAFVKKLVAWFEKPMAGPRIVVTHHAPTIKPNTKYRGSNLFPAFNSLDMEDLIRRYQPELWIYGHTHECDNQILGKTQIISNQLGYPNPNGGYECSGFDEGGVPIMLKFA